MIHRKHDRTTRKKDKRNMTAVQGREAFRLFS